MSPALPWWRRPWAKRARRVLAAVAGVASPLLCQHYAPAWLKPYCQAFTAALWGAG